jgi:hypothetical protein
MSPFDRRAFLSATPALPFAGCIARPLPVTSPYASAIPERETGTLVNDVHSQLNATQVAAIKLNVPTLDCANFSSSSEGTIRTKSSRATGTGITRRCSV